ncbi:hypothetical protein [Pelagicoccus mobilis]|uniref:Uncharacterized protein n=1 Tax=Pelagicoccus mobilis TaxID=415221 RepID=A0A934RYU9_9BACT|nr:hypothetical protein [Pelagicoccus mobilis]MBK1877381.1 hypothetical protein [Pelagicoccus mobilis]
MPTSTQNQAGAASSIPPAPSPSLDVQLSQLASDVIAYARDAKVVHFRYCRNPKSPSSPHASLQAAIDALQQELQAARQQPVCQPLAAELLKELAALGHQPPCQSKPQQRQAAQTINAALLELR